MNKLNKALFVVTTTICLVNCGGGEEEKDTKEKSQIQPPPVQIVNTGDLVSNTQFDFSSGYTLNVVLAPLENNQVRHFINICTDFSLTENGYSINYDSCKLRTSFSENNQEFELSLSAAETNLIAQIWPIENNATPIELFWTTNESSPWAISP